MSNLDTLKQDKNFNSFIKECFNLDANENLISKSYAYVVVKLTYKNKFVSLPMSHLVWYLKYDKWPVKGLEVHHKDDNPFNNKSHNLENITKQQNLNKKIGKRTRLYGTKSKYGYGICIHYYKRDNIYVVVRYFPSDESKELGFRQIYLGSFKKLEEAEKKVNEYVINIDNPLYGVEV